MDFKQETLEVNTETSIHKQSFTSLQRQDEQQYLYPTSRTTLAPRTTTMVHCKGNFYLSDKHSSFFIIEETLSTASIKGRIFIPRVIVTKQQINNGICLPIINPTEQTITLNLNTIIGQTEALQDDVVFILDKLQQTPEVTNTEELNLYKMPATSISDEELIEITKKAPLSEAQKIKLQQLLLNNKKVFCRDSLTKPGAATWGHHIPLENTFPTRERIRRQTQTEMEVTSSEVKKMLEQNIIQPSSSPWAAPVQIGLKERWRSKILYRLQKTQQSNKKRCLSSAKNRSYSGCPW